MNGPESPPMESTSTTATTRGDPTARPPEDATAGTQGDRPPASREEASVDGPAAPPVPDVLEDTGLSRSTVTDLVLKTLYSRGASRGRAIAETLCLSFSILDDVLLSLKQMRLVEVRGSQGHGREGYEFGLTGAGIERAKEAREMNAYVGPAPVPLGIYREWVARQSIEGMSISREMLSAALDDLTLRDEVLSSLGPAVNSGSSIFLYGAPGNGKTAIAERLGRMSFGDVYIPHAVEVHGEVMVLFDPIYHERVEPEVEDPGHEILRPRPPHDPRFVRIKRPMVGVGGELTMDQLDLQMDPDTKIYQAPFQLKATHGILLIDDFGRQRMQPHELLNRWIVPLEKGVDYLGLKTGVKFSVPFQCLPVFSTNLDPVDLVDEAFLRRIQFKIEVPSPDRQEYTRIFRDVCREKGVEYSEDAVSFLFDRFYGRKGVEPRGCHPRDILRHLQSGAAFEGTEPRLTPSALEAAARAYFLIMDADAMEAENGRRAVRGTGEGAHAA